MAFLARALFGVPFFLLLAAAGAAADQPYSFDATYGMLPKTVVPEAYDIALTPDLRTRATAGHETVRIRVRKPVKTIAFDTNEIVVARASLGAAFGTPAIATDAKTERTTLTFEKTIAPGTYTLALAFAGKIGTDPEGLFVQPYTTSDGAKEEMLATQFESRDARRMFPSWDEPAFRATYRLTVTVPSDFTPVSNMPIAHETHKGDVKTVTFARTPSMSTYLVVFCAGRFASISDTVDGVKISVIAPHDRIAKAGYALESEKKLLAYYDTYYGYKFPLPKLDLIDVPGGFPGAMENWGGITFTESALLFDPKIERETAKIDIFETIAHEMSHQWTGDLVTMDWWSGLWLNESFADWMQTKATDHFNPQWRRWDAVEGDTRFAMASDEKTTTHPIEQPILDDKTADSTFDEITYQKGGAVIRMLEQYLGEDTFRDGVRTYLRAHAYSNTTAADLWAALGSAAHVDVAKIAEPFVTTPGLPLVTATATCANGERTIALAQQRFFVEAGQTSSQLWTIPVGIDVGGTRTYTLLSGPTATVDGGKCDTPYLVNAGAVGYFRTRLDDDAVAAKIARFDDLGVADRARFIDDADAGMLAGFRTPAQVIAAIAAVKTDDALSVWSAAGAAVSSMADLEQGQAGEAAFEAYERRLLEPVFARVGWDAAPGEDALTGDLRETLIRSLGYAGDRDVIAEAQVRFAKFVADPSSLAPGLRAPVLTLAGTYADAATWDHLRALFKNAKSPIEGQQFAIALWGARDPELAKKNLAMALGNDIPADYGGFMGYLDVVYVALAGRHADLAWPFLKANATPLAAKLSSFEVPLVVPAIVPLFWNTVPQSELDAFIDGVPNLPPPLAAKAKHQIAVNLAERERLLPAIDAATEGPARTAVASR